MTGRHARGRHSAAVDDWPQPLADLIRDTGGLPAVAPIPDPMNPRDEQRSLRRKRRREVAA